jgi:hypothetical protein
MHTVARTISLARALACGLAIGGAAAHGVEIPVAYESPGDGFLSLVLHDDQGAIVRSLLSAEPVKAGMGKVEWDGTDDLGRVCKPATLPTPRPTARGVGARTSAAAPASPPTKTP